MAEDDKALVPILERTIPFYEDEIAAVLVEVDGQRQVYIPIRPLCKYLGVDWSGQRQRLLRDEVLAEDMTSVVITPTLIPGQQYKQRYTVTCLPLEDLPGWLFGISPSRVNPEFRGKVKRYRRECYRVLWQAFASELLTAHEAMSEETTDSDHAGALVLATPTSLLEKVDEHEYSELLAVTNLVREHLEILTGAVMPMTDKLDYAVKLLEALVGRQEVTEKKVAKIDERTQRLTPEHARTVANLVEQIIRQTKQTARPLDHYKVYGMLKQRFRVTTYKEIADERFTEVMGFLQETLRQALEGKYPQQESLF